VYRTIIMMTRSATTIVGALADCVIDGSASASRPPLTPASATPRTTTPNPGSVTPVRYLNRNPRTQAIRAGMMPVRMPR